MITYLDKHNIKSMFKLVNIDNIDPPKEIDIVPTIVDTELIQPLKGKKAFEYLLNIKYFNNPTNNIDYIKDLPDNPLIPIDDKANNDTTQNLEIDKNIIILEPDKNIVVERNNIPNKKLATLLKLKRK
jgi:hypothetical protein